MQAPQSGASTVAAGLSPRGRPSLGQRRGAAPEASGPIPVGQCSAQNPGGTLVAPQPGEGGSSRESPLFGPRRAQPSGERSTYWDRPSAEPEAGEFVPLFSLFSGQSPRGFQAELKGSPSKFLHLFCAGIPFPDCFDGLYFTFLNEAGKPSSASGHNLYLLATHENAYQR